MTSVKYSSLVEGEFPKYLLQNRDLVAFLKNYYKWTEQDGNFQDVADRLATNFFRDYADEDFIDFFVTSMIPNFPATTMADRAILLRYAREFYQSKGSLRSIKFLIKAVFGVDSTIYLPKQDIFRLSNTKFGSVLTMVVNSFDPLVSQMAARRIVGATSGASATVDRVDYVASPSNSTLYIQDVVGTFVVGELLSTVYDENLNPIFANVFSLPVQTNTITGDDSMASGTKKFQDGEYYQEFSYVVRNKLDESLYGPIVDKLAHPLGTKRIGEKV